MSSVGLRATTAIRIQGNANLVYPLEKQNGSTIGNAMKSAPRELLPMIQIPRILNAMVVPIASVLDVIHKIRTYATSVSDPQQDSVVSIFTDKIAYRLAQKATDLISWAMLVRRNKTFL